jgi:ribosome maturation protein SDO1
MNVSKGEVARHGDLEMAFGKAEIHDIVKEILKKGEVQVGEKEREHDLISLRKEIATLVAEKCVDPATQTPYPVGMIEKAMSEAGYSVRQGKNAKSQVGECIKLLQSDSKLPIQRARMRIRVSMPNEDAKQLREKVLEGAEKVENDEVKQDEWNAVMLIDPSQFRVINELLQKECKGKGRIETLLFAATAAPAASADNK